MVEPVMSATDADEKSRGAEAAHNLQYTHPQTQQRSRVPSTQSASLEGGVHAQITQAPLKREVGHPTVADASPDTGSFVWGLDGVERRWKPLNHGFLGTSGVL